MTMVSESTTVISRATVLVEGTPVGILEDLVPGGTVTLDTTAANVRTCAFSCLDPTGALVPGDDGSGLLQPDGVEVALEAGFLINGNPVLWPQGVFGIKETDAETGAGGTLAPGPVLPITGVDRSRRISKALLDDTFTIAQGTNVQEAILLWLAKAAPWVVNPNIEPTAATVAQQVYQPGQDPWQAIVAIAAAAGMVAYFDASGVLVVRTNPATAGAPVALWVQEGPNNIANAITAATSNSPGYNGVIVVGTSASGTNVIGSAYDLDPSSLTYSLGPYGKRPSPPVQVSTVLTVAQATAMAQALLPQVLGLSRSVAMSVLPVPFLDAYDVLYIASSAVKVKGTYLVQQATIPLDYSTLESLTGVPVGAPIDQLAALQGPSAALYASTSPIYAGGGAFTASQTGYSWGALGATAINAGQLGAFGAGGLTPLGGGGGGVGWGVLWGGHRLWSTNGTRWTSGDSDVAGEGDSD